jgi:hypothetical protein
MKIKFGIKFLAAVLLAVGITGCVTHRINWAGRIGNYSFDQAIVDMGPPDKQAKLSDGRVVAEWITRYHGGGTVMLGGGFYSRPGGLGFVETTPSDYESKLRLTFSTNNVLAGWSRD